ncbi:MAG: hypothetical protein AVDCRST_MAG68-1337, partial [uncultured Gemmatimonadetes bacterium]
APAGRPRGARAAPGGAWFRPGDRSGLRDDAAAGFRAGDSAAVARGALPGAGGQPGSFRQGSPGGHHRQRRAVPAGYPAGGELPPPRASHGVPAGDRGPAHKRVARVAALHRDAGAADPPGAGGGPYGRRPRGPLLRRHPGRGPGRPPARAGRAGAAGPLPDQRHPLDHARRRAGSAHPGRSGPVPRAPAHPRGGNPRRLHGRAVGPRRVVGPDGGVLRRSSPLQSPARCGAVLGREHGRGRGRPPPCRGPADGAAQRRRGGGGAALARRGGAGPARSGGAVAGEREDRGRRAHAGRACRVDGGGAAHVRGPPPHGRLHRARSRAG